MKILVTGTSSGIGLATAKLFCEAGHEVIGFDIQPARYEHANFKHYDVDVRCIHDFPDIGDVDAIVNNAGSINEDEALDVNVIGYVNIVDSYYTEKCKSIVIVSSISGHCGLDTPKYAASQGGRLALAKHWAINLGKKNGCRVNSISPGATVTGLERPDEWPKSFYDAVANESILGKWQRPENVAKWIYFITCVDDSMSGQDVLVDDGEVANRNFINVRGKF